MALRLGELSTVITVDDREFERGLQQARSRFGRFGDRLKVASAAAGAAVGVALAAGLAGAMDLDKARARLAAQIGDPAMAKQLGEVAGRLYTRGFGDSAAQNMQAVQAAFSTGLVPQGDAAALEDLTVKAQAYATAWGTDVTEAMSTASTLVKSGLAKDATHALDLLTVASRKVPVAMVGDLQEVSAEYAQFFDRLGFSGEQAFALLASGADKGTWGIDKVGDAIKEFSALATELDGKPADALATLGLNARQMQNDLLAGGDTARAAFDKTVDALLRVKDPAEQASLAMDLFGTPLEDLSKADIPDFLASLDQAGAGLGDVSGAAKKAGETLEQSTSQRLQAFKNQVQQALIDKVGAALPYLEKVGRWADDNSTTLLTVAGIIGGLAVTVWAVQGAMAAWNAVQLIWTGITKGAAAAQWLWNAAMAANPVGLVVLAVVALIAGIVLLWQNSEAFRNFFISMWEGISAFFVGLFEKWWALFSGFWGAVFDGVAAGWRWVVDKVSGFVSFVGSLPGKIRDKARGMFDGIKNAFKSAINWIIQRWNNFSLRIPPISVPGIGQVWGGMTLSLPPLPMLAKGGTALTAGAAIVGERGPELLHMPRGATVQPLASGPAMAGMLRLLLSGEFRVRGGDLVLVLREEVATRGGDVQQVVGTSS